MSSSAMVARASTTSLGRMPCEFRQQDGLRPVPAETAQDNRCRPPDGRLRIGKTGFQALEFRPAERAQPYSELPDLRIAMRQQGTGEGSGKPEGHRQGGAQRPGQQHGRQLRRRDDAGQHFPGGRRPDLGKGLDHRHLFRQETILPEARKPAPQALEGRQGAVAEAALDDKGAEQVCLGNPRARQPVEKFRVRQRIRTGGPGGSTPGSSSRSKPDRGCA